MKKIKQIYEFFRTILIFISYVLHIKGNKPLNLIEYYYLLFHYYHLKEQNIKKLDIFVLLYIFKKRGHYDINNNLIKIKNETELEKKYIINDLSFFIISENNKLKHFMYDDIEIIDSRLKIRNLTKKETIVIKRTHNINKIVKKIHNDKL